MKHERIAVLAIGNSKVFETAKIISNTLDIPYITINPDAISTNKKEKLFEINLHPPVSKIIAAMIDIISHYKWGFVTILFQEPSRIEDLIRYASSEFRDAKLYFQYKLISKNTSEWNSQIKSVRASGASHIIIDIETKYINTFLRMVIHLKIIFFIL